MDNLSKYEVYLISALAHGATIIQTRKVLRYYKLRPYSLSSIDKKLFDLRKRYQCKTTFQLIYKLSDRVEVMDLEDVLE
ncbi:hypothetical protein [Leeuwenhoekiella sp. ZYFB001]|uniref:hypothetical protein n=1 Tax=Leeuwenhoekiella sp. ZYFB001 TaxID=2719912 RepID=UPI001431A4D0|nr:hypothetical protein [Leeuwenhoekiella sp. ZYFB001]